MVWDVQTGQNVLDTTFHQLKPKQLEWKPNHDYFKGQVIILDESLKVAIDEFTSNDSFEDEHWDNYEKHDYATFNVWHTWIEYINRLLGALSGFLFYSCFSVLSSSEKIRPKFIIWSFVALVLLLFQAWLGATVVYSVLLPARITIHMLVALIIVALLLYIIHISNPDQQKFKVKASYKGLLIFGLILSLVQIGLGTQVRQFVDESVRNIGYEQKSQWLDGVDIKFYIHRSMSILVLLVNIGLWFFNRKFNYKLDKYTNALVFVIIIEIFTGILMYYFDFPFLTQPLHLIIAALMFSLQFYIFVKIQAKSKLKMT